MSFEADQKAGFPMSFETADLDPILQEFRILHLCLCGFCKSFAFFSSEIQKWFVKGGNPCQADFESFLQLKLHVKPNEF